MSEANWYVVHTYSGYENKVKANIEKMIENRKLHDQIFEVSVRLEVIELKNGVRKRVQKKMFPGYVLIHMVMNDDIWYVVRNTRGVTGFVGPDSKQPVPLSETEMRSMGIKGDDIVIDFEIGDTVTVITGVWENTTGVIKQINPHKQIVTISVDLFGRETPVEISFSDVRLSK